MRSIFILCCSMLSFSALAQEQKAAKEAVVLELFTSEGCSSCPPFEELADELSEQYGDQLIVLAQHVDYWDYLGWKDKWASPHHTARQSEYRNQFKERYLVTPQFIGNGKQIVHGNYVRSWINKHLNDREQSQINFSTSLCDEKNLCIDYSLMNPGEDEWLCIALIESDISSDVKAGENRGRSYNHQNIVHYLKRFAPDNEKGSLTYQIPESANLKNCEVVGFIQDRESLEISGAIRKKLQ